MRAPSFSSCPGRVGLASAGLALILCGCSLVEDLDPLQSGGGGGGTSSSTSTTSSTTTSTTSAGGGGEGGGGGGAPDPCVPTRGWLVSCGLAARYYLDEAASGSSPAFALDAASSPLDLPITYATDLSYTEVAGQRGLRWAVAAEDGGPAVAIAGTKLQDLHGAQAASIEVVVDIDEATSSTSRLCNLGAGPYSALALGTDLPEVVEDVPVIGSPVRVEVRARFETADYTYVGFPVALGQLGRVVLHAVVDASEDAPVDRVRLYVNGTRVARDGIYSVGGNGTGPQQGELLWVEDTETFSIGNRTLGERSPNGTIFYTALYAHPLDQAQITHNVAHLLADDDAP